MISGTPNNQIPANNANLQGGIPPQQQQQFPPQYFNSPQGVPLSYVIHRLVEQSYTNLLQLSESLVDKSDEGRKKSLVNYLEGSRERFIRLLVLVKWAHYLPNLTNAANIINFLNQQDFYLRDAADSLCHLHTRLYTARAPGYDIPTAIDVLTTGTYQRLPTVIKQTAKSDPLDESEVASTLQRLDDLLCFRLLSVSVPKQFTTVKVANGKVLLTVKDEYTVHLTVNGEEMNDPWQVLSLQLLLRPLSHKDKSAITTDGIGGENKEEDGVLPAVHIRRVVDVVNLRMAESANPLQELHTIVHYLVVSLMMDILRTQALTLKLVAPSPQPPPGAPPLPLVVNYWNDNASHISTSSSSANANPPPSLKIYIHPSSANLVIEHHPLIVDPLTGAEPQFKLVPTAISIENLLMQAVRHHARSRVYALAQRMRAHAMISQHVDDSSKDVVCVALFGGWRLVIGVDYTTGRYVARDSSLPPDLIPNLEDSFNADNTSIPDVAAQLRVRAVCAYVERITHVIPLESFRSLPQYSSSNSSSSSSSSAINHNTLYLRYPAIEPSVHYHLCVTVAPDLIPTFTLVRVTVGAPNTNSNNNNTNIASSSSNSQQSVYPIPINVKHPITERTYDKAVGGAISIGAQRRAYLMIVSELSVLGFAHQIKKEKVGGGKQGERVAIQVTLPEPLPFSPVLLPALPRTPPFSLFSLSPIYSTQDNPLLPTPSHMGWQITATGTKSKQNVNTPRTKIIQSGKGYGDISCTKDSWTFSYNILSPNSGGYDNGRNRVVNRNNNNKKENGIGSNSMKLFVQDVHGVAAIHEIHRAIQRIVPGTDLEEFFKVHAVGPTAIHLNCKGEGVPECTASIEWKGAEGITVDFSPTNNPFSPFLQRILTSSPPGDTSPYQPIISFLLHVRHSLELVHHVMHYLEHPAISLLPGDIVIIPRSGNLLRMVYRNSYGVDFRISNTGIHLEDAGEPGPYSSLSATPRERIPQQKITNFAAFMEEKKAILGNPTQPTAIPTVLKTLHSFLWLWRASVRIFTELGDTSHSNNSSLSYPAPILPSNVKSELINQRLAIKVTMHGIQYTFAVQHYETFDIFPAPLTPPTGATHQPYSMSMIPSHGLTNSEAEAIANFWRQNVATPPYRPTSLISFIRILALPLLPLKEFAELMAMSQNLQDDHITLCLSHTVGPKHMEAVVHVGTSCEINFILRFVPSASTPPSPLPPPSSLSSSLALSSASVRPDPHNSATEIGLRYQYASHNLRVWNGVSGGGAEEDAAHADMLDRAIARARKIEPDNVVNGSGMLAIPTLPAVVRALLFLRNPSVP